MTKKLENALVEIIENNEIRTQNEITEQLEKRNISTTQSNISRALKKTGAIKSLDKNGNSIYTIQRQLLEVDKLISNLISSIGDNGFVIAIKTYPGAANIVGQVIDERAFKEEIMATVAGDDVLIVFPKNVKSIKKLVKELENFLLFKN